VLLKIINISAITLNALPMILVMIATVVPKDRDLYMYIKPMMTMTTMLVLMTLPTF